MTLINRSFRFVLLLMVMMSVLFVSQHVTNAGFLQNDSDGYFEVDFLSTEAGITASAFDGGYTRDNITVDPFQGVIAIDSAETSAHVALASVTPSSFNTWDEVEITSVLYGTSSDIQVEIMNCTDDTVTGVIQAAENLGADGTVDISGISSAVDCIRPRIIMSESVGSPRPVISNVRVKWDPLPAFLIAHPALDTNQAGGSITYTILYSNSYAESQDVVVWAPLSRKSRNTIDNYTVAYGQDLDPKLKAAQGGGEFTGSAITVRGQSIPANSVYWEFDSMTAGETGTLTYQVKTDNGIENLTEFYSIAYMAGNNINGVAVPMVYSDDDGVVDPVNHTGETKTTILSSPDGAIDKEVTGTVEVDGNFYVYDDGGAGRYTKDVTYNIYVQNIYKSQNIEEIFNPIVTDDLSDLIDEMIAVDCNATGSTDPTDYLARFTDISGTGVLGDFTSAATQTITWDTSNFPDSRLEPGDQAFFSFKVSFNGCGDDLARQYRNVATLSSDNTGSPFGFVDVYVGLATGVDADAGDSIFAKGDVVFGKRGANNNDLDDNWPPSIASAIRQPYLDVFSYVLKAQNNFSVRLDDIIMQDIIPDGITFSAATIPYGDIYYSINAADPAFTLADIGSTANGWDSYDTNPPLDPTTVAQVAFYVDCLNSEYFPSTAGNGCDVGGVQNPSRTEGNIEVIVDVPAVNCSTDDITNTAEFSLEEIGSSVVNNTTIVNQVLYTDNELTHIGPPTPIFTQSDIVGSGTINVSNTQEYTITIKNSGFSLAENPQVVITTPTTQVNGVDNTPIDFVQATGGNNIDLTALPNSVTIDLDDIPIGGESIVTIEYGLPSGVRNNELLYLDATVGTPQNLPIHCNAITENLQKTIATFGVPDMSIFLDRDESLVPGSGDIHYDVKYFNVGTSPSTGTYAVMQVPNETIFKTAYTTGTDGSLTTFTCTGCEIYFATENSNLPVGLSVIQPFDGDIIANYFTPGEEVAADLTTPTPGSGIWMPPSSIAAEDVVWVAYNIDNNTLVPPQNAAGSLGTGEVGLTVTNDADNSNMVADPSPSGTIVSGSVAIFSNELIQAIAQPVFTTILPDPALKLDKYTAEEDEIIVAGETFDWPVDYFNDSGTATTFAVLSDTLPLGVTLNTISHSWNATSIANGAPAGTIDITANGNVLVTNNADGTVTVDFDATGYRGGNLAELEGGTFILNVTADASLSTGAILENNVSGEFVNGGLPGFAPPEKNNVFVANPDLYLRKQASETSPLQGETVTYTLIVSNEATNGATGVTITDTLPVDLCYVAGTTNILNANWTISANPDSSTGSCGTGETLTWTSLDGTADGEAAAGEISAESQDLYIQYDVLVSVTAANAVGLTNSASVATTVEDPDVYTNTASITVTPPEPEMSLDKEAESVVLPGETFLTTLDYANNSRQPATNTYIIDTLPDEDNDGTVDVTLITVKPSDTGATVYYSDDSLLTAAPAFTSGVGGASWNTSAAALGGPVTYFAIDLGTVGTFESGTVSVSTQAVDPDTGDNSIAGLVFINNAEVITDSDSNLANNADLATTVTPGADLSVQKEASIEGSFPGITPGEGIIYTVTFANTGTLDVCGVEIVDTYDDTNLTLVNPIHNYNAIQLTNSSGNATSPVDPSGNPIQGSLEVEFTQVGDTLTWTLGDTDLSDAATPTPTNICLEPGMGGTFDVYAEVSDDAADSTVLTNSVTVNKLSAGVEDDLTNNTDDSSTVIWRSDVLTIKEGENQDGNLTEVDPGDTLTYTITYNNAGNTDADDVVLTETVPPGTCFADGTATPVVDTALEYSNDGGFTWVYTPVAGSNYTGPTGTVASPGGTDCNVTHFRYVFNSPLPNVSALDAESCSSTASCSFGGTFTNTQSLVWNNFRDQDFQVDQDALTLEHELGPDVMRTKNDLGLTAGAKAGTSIASLGDWDGDGDSDFLVGASEDATAGTRRGAFYVYSANPVIEDTHASSTPGTRTKSLIPGDINGTPVMDDADLFGSRIEVMGDIDGDGTIEVAVGAPGDDDGGSASGAIYILSMNPANSGIISYQKLSITSGGAPDWSATAKSFVGYNIRYAGDLDGDGNVELFVASLRDDDDGNAQTGAWYTLSIDPTTKNVVSSVKQTGLDGLPMTQGGNFNRWGAFSIDILGDLDGDGHIEIAVGANSDDTWATNGGAVYIHSFNTTTFTFEPGHTLLTFPVGTAHLTPEIQDGESAGISITSLGDWDNDGNVEIIVGVHKDNQLGNEQGTVWMVDIDSTTFDIVGDITDLGETGLDYYYSNNNANSIQIDNLYGRSTDVVIDPIANKLQILVGAPKNRGDIFEITMQIDPNYVDSGTYQTSINTVGTLTAWDKLFVEQEIPDGTTLEYEIFDNACSTSLVARGPLPADFVSLSSIDPATHTSLCMKVYMETVDEFVTPVLNNWRATYVNDLVPSFSFDVVIRDADLFQPTVDNSVQITTSTPESNTDNNAANYQHTLVIAELQIEKDVDRAAASVPDIEGGTNQLVYTLDYKNNGPRTAENTAIFDTLPYPDRITGIAFNTAGTPFTCLASDINPIDGNSETVTCSADGTAANGVDLTNQEEGTITITVDLDTTPATWSANESLTNAVIINADTYDPDQTNNSDTAATVIGDYPNVYIIKDGDTVVNLNEVATYTLEYGNNGNVVANAVTIVDTYDPVAADELEIGATTDVVVDLTLAPHFTSCDISVLGIISCTPTTGTLLPGDTGTISVDFTINNNFNLLTNTALDSNNDFENEVVISTTDIEITTADNEDDTTAVITPLGPATFSGYVYEDKNDDGIRDAGENLVEDVIVFLAGADSYGNIYVPDKDLYPTQYEAIMDEMVARGLVAAAAYNSGDAYPAQNLVYAPATSNSGGLYSFAGLTPGTYIAMEVQPTNYASTQSTAGTGATTNGQGSFDNVAVDENFIINTTLAGNEDSVNNNFGESVGRIGDQLFVDIDKDGVWEAADGEITVPAGVTIELVDGSGNITLTQTDANGEYVFEDIASDGTYTVRVTDTGTVLDTFFNTTFGVTTYINTSGTSDTDNNSQDSTGYVVTLTAGASEVLYADFGFMVDPYPDPATIGNLVFDDRNNDGDYDIGTDVPMPGVEMTLTWDMDGDGVVDTDEIPTQITDTTDGQGLYEFTGLLQGASYIVDANTNAAIAGGYVLTVGTTNTDNHSQTDPYVGTLTQSIAINAGSTEVVNEIDFGYNDPAKPASTGIIGDRLYRDSGIGNGRYDIGSDDVLPNVVVELQMEFVGGSGNYYTVRTTTTDAYGEYSFTDLALDQNYKVLIPTGQDDLPADPLFGMTHRPSNLGVTDDIDAESKDPLGYLVDTLTTGAETNNTADFGYTDPGNITSKGFVGTFVWEDRVGGTDGVYDAGTDLPLPGVDVLVYADLDNSGTFDTSVGSPELVRTATTDSLGAYSETRLLLNMDYEIRLSSTQFDTGGAFEDFDRQLGVTATNNEGQLTGLSGLAVGAVNDATGYQFTLDPPNRAQIAADYALKQIRTVNGGLPPDSDGTIGTSVWEDNNADGINNVGDFTMDGITVDLYADLNNDSNFDTSTGSVEYVRSLVAGSGTFANGEYLFEDLLMDMDYRIVVDVAQAALTSFPHKFTGTADTDNNGQVAEGYDVTLTDAVLENINYADFAFNDSPSAEGFGAIGNMVFEDRNNDGDYDLGTDVGIPGVDINLWRDNGTTPGVIDGGDTLITGSPLTTAADGTYLFTNLALGAAGETYLVEFVTASLTTLTTAGYVSTDGQAGGGGTADGAAKDPTAVYSIFIEDDNAGTTTVREDLDYSGDFGFYLAANDASITATGTIGNHVFEDVDPGTAGTYDLGTDVPLENVAVELFIDLDNSGTFNTATTGVTATEYIGTQTTDASGFYEFTNLAHDYDYLVRVQTGQDAVLGDPLFEYTYNASPLGVATLVDEESKPDTGYTITTISAATPDNETADFGYSNASVGSPTPDSTGVIGDTIFNDLNNNGIYELITDIPIVGAIVELFADLNGDSDYTDPFEAVGTTTTDANGFYEFTNLALNTTYQVFVDITQGIITGLFGGSETNTSGTVDTDNNSQDASGYEVTLTETTLEVIDYADFGFSDNAVSASGSLGGTIFYDLANDGDLDGTDELIQGVNVELWLPGGAVAIGTTTTDVSGNYGFTNVALDRTYTLVVNDTANAIVTLGTPTSTHPNNTLPATADNGSKDPAGYDIALTSAVGGDTNFTADFGYYTGSIGNHVFEDVAPGVAGTFELGTDLPIENVVVELMIDLDSSGTYTPVTELVGTTTTDDLGEYLFEKLALGYDYQVQIQTGQDAAGGQPLFGYTHNTSPLGAATLVDEESKDEAGYIITSLISATPTNNTADFGYTNTSVGTPTPDSDGSIGNLVFADYNNDGDYDSLADAPIDGLDVQLYVDVNSDGDFLDSYEDLGTQTTAGGGIYTFSNLVVDRDYRAILDATQGTLNTLFAGSQVNTSGTADTDNNSQTAATYNMTLTDAVLESINYADFGFSNGTASAPGTIEGTVFHDIGLDGNYDSFGDIPVAGVEITLWAELGIPDGIPDLLLTTTTTDSNGDYQFTGISVGRTYILEVTDAASVLTTAGLTTSTYPVNAPGTTIDGESKDPTGYSVALTSAPGGDLDVTADFGYHTSVTGLADASIGDLVFQDIDGNGIFDGTDIGIAGVEVTLYHDYNTNGVVDAGEPSITDITDATGNYLFGNLGGTDTFSVDQAYIVEVTDGAAVLATAGFIYSFQGAVGTDNNGQDPLGFVVLPTTLDPDLAYADFAYNDSQPSTTGGGGGGGRKRTPSSPPVEGGTSPTCTDGYAINNGSSGSCIYPQPQDTPIPFDDDWQRCDCGPAVQSLQQWLNTNGFLLTPTGNGSPGHETLCYGFYTQSAIMRFQETYADIILAPEGLTAGNGYLGPRTHRVMVDVMKGDIELRTALPLSQVQGKAERHEEHPDTFVPRFEWYSPEQLAQIIKFNEIWDRSPVQITSGEIAFVPDPSKPQIDHYQTSIPTTEKFEVSDLVGTQAFNEAEFTSEQDMVEFYAEQTKEHDLFQEVSSEEQIVTVVEIPENRCSAVKKAWRWVTLRGYTCSR